MTRQEFIENVNSFYDLLNFCSDQGIDELCNDIFDASYLNDILLESIRDMDDWEAIRAFLQQIPPRCEYYREDGYGGYEDADPFFDEYKNYVCQNMDENNDWDEEEEDPEDGIYYEDGESYAERIQQVPDEVDEDIETSSFMDVLGRAS